MDLQWLRKVSTRIETPGSKAVLIDFLLAGASCLRDYQVDPARSFPDSFVAASP
jgi:L-ascorbate metabolism protein UlaG (beta-lactamase superfamily)